MGKFLLKEHLEAYWIKIIKFLNIFIIQNIKILIVYMNIRYICGPRKINYKLDELIVLCLVKNGELWIKSFIEHYFSLGVKHIFFLDNGSCDDTLSIIKRYQNVTILSCALPFKYFKLAMRLYLIYRYGRKRWSLYADIDELFDYPYSNTLNLNDFLAYLNNKAYTAVVMHMLEMFSDNKLKEINSSIEDSLENLYRYYDISDISKIDYYFKKNIINNNDIKVYFGGVRRQVFGPDDNLGFLLTKHSLVLFDGRILPLYIIEHGVRYACIADITCVLYHYKFIGNFYEKACTNAREENYYRNSIQYKRYLDVISKNSELKIKQETAQELASVNDLVENQFLLISQDYLDWVQSHSK